jgi:hypothetical protein
LDSLNLVDIESLRLIPHLDVKFLGVAGLHEPGDLAAVLQGDDVGEEPDARQQAELPDEEQDNPSHSHLLIAVSEKDAEIELASNTS